MAEHGIRVLQILPGNRAIVSTEGFCRLVWRKDGSLYGEFFDLPTAHLLTADGVNNLDAISYPNSQTLRFCNDGLSDDRGLRYYQLMNARRIGAPKSRWNRVKKKHRVKGFRRGRLLNPEVMAAIVPVEGGAK